MEEKIFNIIRDANQNNWDFKEIMHCIIEIDDCSFSWNGDNSLNILGICIIEKFKCKYVIMAY